MALSNSKTIARIEDLTGFKIDDPYCKTGEMVGAIVAGINTQLLGNAKITVNSHAGGTYPIIGIDSTSLAGAIKSNLTGFNLSGRHAQGAALPEAIAESIAQALTGSATVTVPTDGVGLFQIKGVSASLIADKMQESLISSGFKISGTHAKQQPMIEALSTAFAEAITNDARYNVDGVSGGIFIMI